ncbi:hypothetical protein C6P40_004135 [Pichia californica]|uniref:Uncharacterized protein n=1 Tax=Pichia californica TaxID=460514 RepID=A0A9P6WMR4_9ASCO|nr:hypothetical protein C6P42_003906 [[Candida] californica]KAG0689961.1 hypothetical protein C6P40_004135 [[Candida] californica]
MPPNRYTPLPLHNGSSSDIQRSSLSHDNLQDTGLNTTDDTSTSHNNTDSLLNSIPDLPPAYEPSSTFEQFDIDETNLESQSQENNGNLRTKAEIFAQSFNRRIVQPINNVLDPVYQLYCYANAKFEFYISKMGNPLIVKRILYIFIISIVLYFASLSGLNADGVVGSQSDFTNPSKLLEFVDLTVDPKRLEENLEYLSSMPHMSGTSGDLALSKYFMQLIDQSRLDLNSDIIFESYTNYPLDPKVQILRNDDILLECDLKETIDDDDNDSNDFYKLAFNPGSRDMTSKGKLIYANYGTLADYRMLENKSIDINNSILIIKYGGSYPAYRKLRYAQERGAVGVLFISDPEMDSYYTMDSLQRESVAFSDISPGNILAYGNSAGSDVDHNGDLDEKLKNSHVMPSIPSLPIKWKDFKTIMENLKDQGSRIEEWDISIKGENIQIWTGETDEILLQNSLTQRPYKESWNVLGKLQGKEQDTFAVIIGASRDSMCYGANENSGSAILLELMNIFSEMTSSLMWHPLRTIYFASFAGSKYNLAGATNFAVRNSEFFRRDVYAYIDLDDIIQGNHLEMSVDPLFESLVTKAVSTLLESNVTSSNVNVNLNQLKEPGLILNPNSNSLPMVEHHNVAAISLKLTNENDKVHDNINKVYYPKNSCLDTFNNFRKDLLDSDMSKHVFMTKLISSIIIKLVDTPILPYDVRTMLNEYKKSIDNVKKHSKQIATDRNLLNFNDLDNILDRLFIIAEQHEAFSSTWADICDNGEGTEPNLLSVNRWDWNSKLLIMTKVMIEMDGTFGNPWNYNVFYGREDEPELRNDASVGGEVDIKQRLPGIWNAIDKSDWVNAQKQVDHVTEMLTRCIELFQY